MNDPDEINANDVMGVDMVAFINFDILNGTRMTNRFPADKDKDFEPFTLQFMANCCLPDGAHLHQTDQSYIIMSTKDGMRYGIGFFRNKSDVTVARGAIQRALLVISRKPHFHLFEQPSYELLEASITDQEQDPNKLLEKLFNALKIPAEQVITTAGLDSTSHNAPVILFEHQYKLKIPAFYQPARFEGSTSLMSLYKSLKEVIMYVWFYLLQEKRILFVGEKAQLVGMCCLTSCLLIDPLGVDESCLVPYITLPDIDQLLNKRKYIAGSTNQLLFQREEWYDLAIYLPTLEVVQSGKQKYKLSKADKMFLNRLEAQQDLTLSDSWLEDQFSQYTLNFIHAFSQNQLPKQLTKHFFTFQDSTLYKNFMGSSSKRKLLKKFGERKLRAVVNRPPAPTNVASGSIDRTRKKASKMKRRLSSSFRNQIVPISKQQSKNPEDGSYGSPIILGHTSSDTITLRTPASNSSCDAAIVKKRSKSECSTPRVLSGSPIQRNISMTLDTAQREALKSPRLRDNAPQRCSRIVKRPRSIEDLRPIKKEDSDTDFYWDSLFDPSEPLEVDDCSTSVGFEESNSFTLELKSPRKTIKCLTPPLNQKRGITSPRSKEPSYTRKQSQETKPVMFDDNVEELFHSLIEKAEAEYPEDAETSQEGAELSQSWDQTNIATLQFESEDLSKSLSSKRKKKKKKKKKGKERKMLDAKVTLEVKDMLDTKETKETLESKGVVDTKNLLEAKVLDTKELETTNTTELSETEKVQDMLETKELLDTTEELLETKEELLECKEVLEAKDVPETEIEEITEVLDTTEAEIIAVPSTEKVLETNEVSDTKESLESKEEEMENTVVLETEVPETKEALELKEVIQTKEVLETESEGKRETL